MNMKKRWMAALMAAVMSLSFLSGCGSDAESGNNSEEGGTTVLKMGHVYAEDYGSVQHRGRIYVWPGSAGLPGCRGRCQTKTGLSAERHIVAGCVDRYGICRRHYDPGRCSFGPNPPLSPRRLRFADQKRIVRGEIKRIDFGKSRIERTVWHRYRRADDDGAAPMCKDVPYGRAGNVLNFSMGHMELQQPKRFDQVF